MLLSRPEILAALEVGDIIIDPFDERNLGTASYDVTLGPHFYREVGWHPTTRVSCDDVLCAIPATLANVYTLLDHGLWAPGDLLTKDYALGHPAVSCWPMPGIDIDDQLLILAPEELVLAHTVEFIGSTSGNGDVAYTTQMHSRSTTVRMGLDVCGSGGWGDHGFCNRWTMEIRNNLRLHHVPLIVGRRVAQISFHKTAPIRDGDDYSASGKYCDGSIDEMKAAWKPERMLPLAYKDREANDPSYQKIITALFGTDRPIDPQTGSR